MGKALSQFQDPRFWRPLALGFAVSALAFAALWGVAGYLLFHARFDGFPWLGAVAGLFGGVAALALSWVLFPTVVISVSTLFLESVIRAVEARFYPGNPMPREQGWFEQIEQSLKILLLALSANFLCLPLYFFPGVSLFVFPVVNGFLIGREYFEWVALRRVGRNEMRRLRARNRGTLWLTGTLFAVASLLPIVGFLVPVAAAATMTHLFEAWHKPDPEIVK